MAVPFSNTRLRVPKGFQNVLEGLAREVLRSQPENIYSFSEAYFEELLRLRQETGYDDITLLGAKLEDRFYNNHSFKNPNVNTNNDEQQSAAVVIQSEYRRFAAKKEVDSIKEDEAATVIQASFRGHLERETITSKRTDDEEDEGTTMNQSNLAEDMQGVGIEENEEIVQVQEEILDKEDITIVEDRVDIEAKEPREEENNLFGTVVQGDEIENEQKDLVEDDNFERNIEIEETQEENVEQRSFAEDNEEVSETKVIEDMSVLEEDKSFQQEDKNDLGENDNVPEEENEQFVEEKLFENENVEKDEVEPLENVEEIGSVFNFQDQEINFSINKENEEELITERDEEELITERNEEELISERDEEELVTERNEEIEDVNKILVGDTDREEESKVQNLEEITEKEENYNEGDNNKDLENDISIAQEQDMTDEKENFNEDVLEGDQSDVIKDEVNVTIDIEKDTPKDIEDNIAVDIEDDTARNIEDDTAKDFEDDAAVDIENDTSRNVEDVEDVENEQAKDEVEIIISAENEESNRNVALDDTEVDDIDVVDAEMTETTRSVDVEQEEEQTSHRQIPTPHLEDTEENGDTEAQNDTTARSEEGREED